MKYLRGDGLPVEGGRDSGNRRPMGLQGQRKASCGRGATVQPSLSMTPTLPKFLHESESWAGIPGVPRDSIGANHPP